MEPNVIPPELRVTFDFRLSLNVDLNEFENQLKKWMEESGGGIKMKFIQKNPRIPLTKVDESNPFWMALKEQFESM